MTGTIVKVNRNLLWKILTWTQSKYLSCWRISHRKKRIELLGHKSQ